MVSAGIYEEFAKKLADNDRPHVQGRIQIGGEFCRKRSSMSGSWVFHKGQQRGECRKTCGRGDERTLEGAGCTPWFGYVLSSLAALLPAYWAPNPNKTATRGNKPC